MSSAITQSPPLCMHAKHPFAIFYMFIIQIDNFNLVLRDLLHPFQKCARDMHSIACALFRACVKHQSFHTLPPLFTKFRNLFFKRDIHLRKQISVCNRVIEAHRKRQSISSVFLTILAPVDYGLEI